MARSAYEMCGRVLVIGEPETLLGGWMLWMRIRSESENRIFGRAFPRRDVHM